MNKDYVKEKILFITYHVYVDSYCQRSGYDLLYEW